MFYHRTNKRPTEAADHGTREKNTYAIEVDQTGHKKVVKSGKTNTYKKIQEYAESTKIENIVNRFTAGDLTALKVREGIYTDVVGFPTSLPEAQNSINKLKEKFKMLPIDIRAAFDHSAEKFIAEFGTESFNKKMGFDKIKENIPKPEVTELNEK